MLNLGLQVSEANPCMYIRERDDKKFILGLNVGDGLLAAKDPQDLEMLYLERSKSISKLTRKEFFKDSIVYSVYPIQDKTLHTV